MSAGQAGGGGMWPPLSGASGGPPVSAYGVPGFNGVYPGLVPSQAAHAAAAQAASHLGSFVQPNPYPQPQSMMQRQLGHSQLLMSRGGHPATSMAASMAASMLPPSANPRMVELQEKKRQEAERRRRNEEEKKQSEKAKEDFWKSSLFEEPTKVASGENTVAQVLGKFDSSTVQAMNMNNIGVDYAPPTPAPVQHIIGEEDDMPAGANKPLTPAQALYGHHPSMGMHRPNPIPMRKPNAGTMPGPPSNRQRLPDNIAQVYPPTSRPSAHHHRMAGGVVPPRSGSMEPPGGLPQPSRIDHTFREPTHSAMVPPSATSNRLKEQRRGLPNLNLPPKTNEQDINNIFKEMINPLNPAGSGNDANTVMPPPLSAIYTPKVAKHEGNMLPSKRIYSFGQVPVSVSPPPSPIKPITHSPERTLPSAIQNSRQVKNDSMHVPLSGSFTNPTLSEESESEHEKLPNSSLTTSFDPRVETIVKKPPAASNPSGVPPPGSNLPTGATSVSGNKAGNNHTSSDSSESEDTTSDDSSSDEDQKKASSGATAAGSSTSATGATSRTSKTATTGGGVTSATSANAETDAGNNRDNEEMEYDLNSLFKKANRMSPGSSKQISQSTPFAPEELLSQERSPFSISILGASEDKIMDISKPISPLQGSPPSSTNCSGTSRSKRRTRHSTTPRQTSKNIVESSDEDNTEPIQPRKTPKKTPPKPRKTALPNKVTPNSVSHEDEVLSDAHFASSKNNKKRPKVTKPLSQAPSKQQPQHSEPSSEEEEENESDRSIERKIRNNSPTKKAFNQKIQNSTPISPVKSPRKRKVPKSELTPQVTELTAASPSSRNLSNQQQPSIQVNKSEETKIESKKSQKQSLFKNVFRNPEFKKSNVGQVQPNASKIKQEPLEATAILKRTDGRPILICNIPLSLLEHKPSRKRERKTSTSSTASAASKKSKKFEVSTAEVKPEATILENLPGYGGPPHGPPGGSGSTSSSLRNLMPPPPDHKLEAQEEQPQHQPQTQSHNYHNEDEFQIYMTQAKKLKHEADKESNNRERQAMKYLEAVLFFILCGSTTETRGDHAAAYTMYKETLNLVQHVTRVGRGSSGYANITDNKLAILSYRCQSLLYLKLYKLRKNELKECQQKLEDLLMNASKNGLNSPVGNGGGSPTPSPAGSEGSVCSKSSGYTSSGELPMTSKYVGVLTPPSSNPCPVGGTMSVPHTLMQKQYNYSNYLTQCHELWEMAEVHIIKGHCSDFITHLDQTYGILTLHSSLKDLVKYTQAGLDYLAKERESLHRARRL